MFRFLRFRLTLLYLFGALLLVAAVDAAVYILMQNNDRAAVDSALEHRVALALHEAGEPLPTLLAQGETEWYARRGILAPVQAPSADQSESAGEAQEDETDEGEENETGAAVVPVVSWQGGEPEYDSELSPIRLLAVRTDGGIESITGGIAPPPDAGSLQSALAGGTDWRTTTGEGGSLRVFTLRLTNVPGYAAIQASRSLADQERMMADLVMGLLQWGLVFAGALAVVAWFLSGRALSGAQAAWAKQQAFVAHAGHELRAPLTMVRASAEMAKRHAPGGETGAMLTDILGETDRMSHLVDDLLFVSRLDAGARRIERRPVDLAALAEETLPAFGRVAAGRGVDLGIDSLQGTAIADAPGLRQILLILLDNALHHSPAGSAISIGATRTGRRIRVTVADRGPGIPPEELPHVFDRFYRGRNEPAGGGSGLGLAIAKELADAMHAVIRIENAPDGGTIAAIDLDVAE